MKRRRIATLALPLALATSPVFAKNLTVPCFDGGGSGGWMFSPSAVPESMYPVRVLRVKELPAGSAGERAHPDYEAEAGGSHHTKYGYCTIAPKGKRR